jgi:hypothetical protein
LPCCSVGAWPRTSDLCSDLGHVRWRHHGLWSSLGAVWPHQRWSLMQAQDFAGRDKSETGVWIRVRLLPKSHGSTTSETSHIWAGRERGQPDLRIFFQSADKSRGSGCPPFPGGRQRQHLLCRRKREQLLSKD